MTKGTLLDALQEGVKIINNIDLSIHGYLDRLEINHGFSNQRYDGATSDIPLPLNEWFSLEKRVVNKLFTGEAYENFSDAIEIFMVPEEIKNAFITTGISHSKCKQQAMEIAICEPYKQALDLFIDTIVKPRLLSDDTPEIESIVFNNCGQKSVTRYHQVGEYAGLHYDNCDHNPPSLVSLSRNRLCFNIGLEPRYFVFRNIFRGDDKCSNKHQFETYPLLKLKINPFEGYIAPIERIMHEGYTYQMTNPDISIAVRSYIGITTLPITKKIIASHQSEEPHGLITCV